MNRTRERLVGLAALVAVVAIIVGAPLLLVTFRPFESISWMDLRNVLTNPDDGSVTFAVLAAVGWAAWAYFTIAILVEIASQLRHRPAPHLPGFSLPQKAARRLVAAAMLVFIAAPMAAGTASAAPSAPTSPTPTATAPQTPLATHAAPRAPTQTVNPDQQAPDPTRQSSYQVKPGDSLRSIAQQHLGDAERWQEIFDASRTTTQPDGQRLVDPDIIETGWTLTIPDSPVNAASSSRQSSYQVRAGDSLRSIAQQHLGDAERWQEIFDASRTTTQPDGQRLVDPDIIETGWTLTIPTTSSAPHTPARSDETPPPARTTTPTPSSAKPTAAASNQTSTPATAPATAPAAPTTSAKPSAPTATPPVTATPSASGSHPTGSHSSSTEPGPAGALPAPPMVPTTPESTTAPTNIPNLPASTTAAVEDQDEAWPVRTIGGVGAIAAAGVITLIGARRSLQQRRRRSGATIAMPDEQTMAVETELRSVADPLAVEDVDHALRQLASTCEATKQDLPVLRAARLTGDQLDLYLAEPDTLPEPWYGTPDKTVWSLAAADRVTPPRRLRETIPAPYPALVTLGHDLEGGHVFIDLEHVGSLAIRTTGPKAEDHNRAILAALAIELATSSWADDDLTIHAVGGLADLEDATRTGRIHYVPTVTVLLDQLEQRTTQDQQILTTNAGSAGLSRARVSAVAQDAWSPEVVLLCKPITSQEHRRLEAIVEASPHVAIAVVTSHEPHLGEWSLEVPSSGPDDAVLQPMGLQLQAQQIDSRAYAAILASVSTATYDMPTEVMAPLASVTPLPDRSIFARPLDEEPRQGDDTVEIRPVVDEPVEVEDRGRDDVVEPTSASALPSALAAFARPATGQVGEGEPEQDEELAREQAAMPVDEVDDQGDVVEESAVVVDESGSADENVVDEMAEQVPVQDSERAGEQAAVEDEAETGGVLLSISDYAKLHPVQAVTTADGQPWNHPLIRVLGQVTIDGVGEPHQPSKRRVWTEYATFMALNPDASVEAIDEAVWPGSASTNNTRRTTSSGLRRWLGDNPDTGQPYFPRYSYHLEGVTTDWDIFQDLVPGAVSEASTVNLAKALSLVRGRPFEGTAGEGSKPRKSSQYRYAWAEVLRQEIVAKVVDVAEELATRSLLQGRWGTCEEAVALGIRMNPGVERLWRIRILAAHQSRDKRAKEEAIERLLVIVEDDLESDLEDETREFLDALADNDESFEQLRARL